MQEYASLEQLQVDAEGEVPSERFQFPRIHTFDFARGLAILFMIMQHTVLIYGDITVKGNFIGLFIIALGTIPAAPVFLILMGICFKFTEQNTIERFHYGIRRGIKLIVLGYILNILRFSIPLFIGLEEFELALYESDMNIVLTPYSSYFIVDILQCAGLSMIFMAIATKYIKKDLYYVLLAILVIISSPFLWGQMTRFYFINIFLNSLWGTNSNVFFPVFPWLTYPLIGMVLGQRLRLDSNIDQLISNSSKIGIILFIISFIIGLRNLGKGIIIIGEVIRLIDPLFQSGSMDHPSPIAIILTIGSVLIWLCFCHLFVEKLPLSSVYNVLFIWSKNVTVMYFFQWILIGWGIFVFGYQSQDLLMTLFLILLIIILTHLSTFFFHKLKGIKISLTL
ncbi:MAG: heparan-alpha-glucosaminide N-acetyltransferase domain-containing protein [Candidatus Hodarchaeota archaeon]